MFDLMQAPNSAQPLRSSDGRAAELTMLLTASFNRKGLIRSKYVCKCKAVWKFDVSTSAVLELPAHVGSNHVTPHVILYLYFNLHFYLYLKVRKVLPPTTLVFVFAFVFTFVFVSVVGANLTDVTPCVTLRLSVGTSNNYLTSSNPFHLYLHLYL